MERSTAKNVVRVYALIEVLGAIGYVLLGLLFVFALPAVLTLLFSFGSATVFGWTPQQVGTFFSRISMLVSLYFFGMAITKLVVAVGLLRYKEWAREVLLATAVADLVVFPLGTFFGGLALYLFAFNDSVRNLFR